MARGSGSASFEMLRYLTERLPAMVTPQWVDTRIQPIAVHDVLRYLAGSATLEEMTWAYMRWFFGGMQKILVSSRCYLELLADRGFDPAAEIAAALAERTGAPLRPCLARSDLGRQLGGRRAQRIGQPPHVNLRGEAPRSVLLIDDVLTTGATLAACARALREGGSIRVAAITFTRRL